MGLQKRASVFWANSSFAAWKRAFRWSTDDKKIKKKKIHCPRSRFCAANIFLLSSLCRFVWHWWDAGTVLCPVFCLLHRPSRITDNSSVSKRETGWVKLCLQSFIPVTFCRNCQHSHRNQAKGPKDQHIIGQAQMSLFYYYYYLLLLLFCFVFFFFFFSFLVWAKRQQLLQSPNWEFSKR